MNIQEAKAIVESLAGSVAEAALKSPVHIADSMTEIYAWGWVFFYTADSEGESYAGRHRRFAIEKNYGKVQPVGTKGVLEAVMRLDKFAPGTLELHLLNSDQQPSNMPNNPSENDGC